MDTNHTSKKIVLPLKPTQDLAYICGILAGDGSINYRPKKNEYSIKCVGNPKDEKEMYTEVIQPTFKKVFGISPAVKMRDGGTTFGLVIYSKDLVTYLTKTVGLPLGPRYGKLAIPKLFLGNHSLTTEFIRGVFDTDGCISFKKRYTQKPYYPVISLCSKSERFMRQIARVLKSKGFKLAELYKYRVTDARVECGYTIINRIDLNGSDNFKKWLRDMGFKSPKHQAKIKKVNGKK